MLWPLPLLLCCSVWAERCPVVALLLRLESRTGYAPNDRDRRAPGARGQGVQARGVQARPPEEVEGAKWK